MSYSWIDKYVDGVIDHCYSRDIYEICDTLNIVIRKLDKRHKLLQGNEAVYIRNFLGEETIFIRDDLPYRYEKFILAHELGHAILHVEVHQAAYNTRLINKGKLERQATYFACKLLDIRLDDVYHYQLSTEQIAGDLGVNEKSIGYIASLST